MQFDHAKAFRSISSNFDESIIPTLIEYIRIPNLSPAFNGGRFDEPETEQVISLFESWVMNQKIPNLVFEVKRLANRTPLIYIEVPASSPGASKEGTILMYGHLDKQPPFEGWDEGTGPYVPVLKNGRLYGRGGADDGYAIFGSIECVKAIQEQNLPHSKIIILIEACEESGSPDLPFYLSSLGLTDVSLIVCLDSGAGSYDAFYMTTSIRGLLSTRMKVSTLTEGVHSGSGGGICADSFRIVRQLLSAIENEETGEMIDEFQVKIPSKRIEQNTITVARLGRTIFSGFPLINGVPMKNPDDLESLALARGWKASLTVTGIDGVPTCAAGGNVLRPSTTVKLSIRLPPSYDHENAFNRLKSKLESVLPTTAKLELAAPTSAQGWDAPTLEPWLEAACETASREMFNGAKPCYIFEGGSIPFLGMLHKMFPKAQFCVTGVLGPHSNAHGPNEFLDVEYCKKIVTCVAGIVASHPC